MTGAQFDGKVAIITGGAQGIGQAYAEAFASEGASVVIADIAAEGAHKVAGQIEASGGQSLGVGADVADEESVAAMIAAAVERFGGVDILVNNAGLHMGKYNLCSTLPVEDWRRLLDVNLLGPVLCARHCRSPMAARGGGVILNQSSSAAYLGVGAYGISKLALNGLTMSLASELAPDQIRVVGIAPGMVASDAVIERLEEENKALVLNGQLIKRFATVEDLLGMALTLCSDASSFVTGQTFLVDGGFVRHV
ncbi:MAG TPA: glucose 1-dehydrogenase [Frankiaceae bacterium]|jgi:NAD(P)-dependent dehydrogenase (short-subunit alcohol dehydrogenase family)|nr:glucose 1-dehydrogenase [Frankiaceae bacterium]